jgi:hypothetical protein
MRDLRIMKHTGVSDDIIGNYRFYCIATHQPTCSEARYRGYNGVRNSEYNAP